MAAIDPTDDLIPDRLKLAHDRLKDSSDHLHDWRKKARECYDFYAGEQWSQEDRDKLESEGRPPITFNRVMSVVDSVAGSEVQNRHEIRYMPREMGDVQVNELLSGAAEWVRDEADAEDEESDAFLDTLICGMGATETRLDFLEDPDGKICISRVDPFEMYYDPTARKKNLVDTRWRARARLYSAQEFKERWPDKWEDVVPEEISELEGDDWSDWAESSFNVRGYEDKGRSAPTTGFDPDSQKFRVIQYEYVEAVKAYKTINPKTGEVEEITKEAYTKVGRMLKDQGYPVVPVQKMKHKRIFFCGRQILEEGDNPVNDFTFHFITGKRDRNKNFFFGLVEPMKDPQRWSNKFFSQILHILNSNAKGGIMAEEGAFADERQAKEDWAKPDSVVFFTPGALSNGKVQPKPIGEYPAGLDRLMAFAISSMRDVTGVNLELLGMAERDQPGVLESQRKDAALQVLATVFDSLRRYRKEQGRALLQFIQRYISDGRLVRINGDRGKSQYVPLTKDEGTAKYDVIVDQSPTSPNEKQKTFELIVQLLPALLQAGVPIPPDLLEYSPLPSALVTKWLEYIEKVSEQQQPGEGGDPTDPAKIQELMSQAQLNSAKAQEIMAKLQMLPQQMQIEMAKASTGPDMESPAEFLKKLAETEGTQAQTMKTLIEAQRMREGQPERMKAATDIAKAKIAADQAEKVAKMRPKPNGKSKP